MLQLRNITKTYRMGANTIRALDDVSVSVKPGEFVSVRGPSGCGKSTLLFTAGALLSPDAGTVTIAGTEPYTLPQNARASFRAETIGFVFQRFHLIPYLDIVDNVLVGDLPIRREQARERALELVKSFGLGGRLGHRPGELSIGEMQRVGLARALLNRPAVVLADEPTGNLDPESAEIVMSALANAAEEGAAVLVVTHSVNAAQRAHRAVCMRDGRIESGGDET